MMSKKFAFTIHSCIQSILLILFSFVFSACVGTVKTLDPTSTRVLSSADQSLANFEGLNSAVAVSDKKVELFFTPIASKIDNYSYIINYDGQVASTYVSANTLTPDYRGFVKYTVTGLDQNKKYTFNVQARDLTTQNESSNNIKIAATTFANPTANFVGVSETRNLSGSAGLNGIEVIWPQAEVKGTEISRNDIDPVEYKITVIDSTSLNPGNMNDPSFGEPLRKVISASSAQRNLIVNGLKPGIKYYVQVRAIHYAFAANSADINYKVEENTTYSEITTYTDDLASVNFTNTSFYLSWPSGFGGLYALIGSWTAPKGNFDHYRMYYAVASNSINLNSFMNGAQGEVDALCSGAETNNSDISCMEADSDQLTGTISGLQPNTTYNVILAVCVTATCERTRRVISTMQNRSTTPNLANFQGITTILPSNDINNLNTAKLNFNLPDFSTGAISGYLVDSYGSDITNDPVTLNDSSVVNTTPFTVDDFDYMTATSLTVRGINYSSTDRQCFLAYPFSYTMMGTKITSKAGLTPVCFTPSLAGPSATDFPGFSSTSDSCSKAGKQVYLGWTAPTVGIYDSYEIFYIKSTTENFSFSSAMQWETNPNYHRIVLDKDQTSYTLTNMATGSGAIYKIGILTYFNSSTSAVRSDYNFQTITCDFR